MVQMTPEQIQARTAFLTSPKARAVRVAHNGFELEVRQPTLGTRNAIYRSAQITAAETDETEGGHRNGKPTKKVQVNFDLGKMQIVSVIACTYFPETDVRVFNDVDYQTLSDQLAGGGIDKLVSAAMELINVKQVDVEKKSDSTQSGSSSTSSP